MCLSTVLTTEHQVVCKNVAAVTQKTESWSLRTSWGYPRWWRAALKKIDLMENEILIRKA